MARVHVFADEAGNFDFSRKADASRYFILTTVASGDCRSGDALMALRRQLRMEGLLEDKPFHASEDRQSVRDRVFAELAGHAFRVDSTILEKCKAQPQTRHSDAAFYQLAWYLHFKHVAPRIVRPGDELLVVGASVGTKARRAAFRGAIERVARQVTGGLNHKVACWDAAGEPCLQVADYCSWAVQRKWERADPRSHTLIAAKISSEFDAFGPGTVNYY